jgi:hypothetical protein
MGFFEDCAPAPSGYKRSLGRHSRLTKTENLEIAFAGNAFPASQWPGGFKPDDIGQ